MLYQNKYVILQSEKYVDNETDSDTRTSKTITAITGDNWWQTVLC